MDLPVYEVPEAGFDTWERERIRRLQSERLRLMVRYVYAHSPFWRRKFDAIGLLPEEIRGVEDLHKIPLCTREELEADQHEHPPFGSYVCTPRWKWAKFFTTSGTTGTPLRRVFSRRDWEYVVERSVRAGWIRPGDVLMILGPVDAVIGPSLGSDVGEEVGALVVHAGLWNTRTKVEMIQHLKPTILSGTASYLVHLSEVAAEMGVDLRGCGIRTLSSVGEPGVAVDATRKLLADRFGVEQIVDGYGMTEIFGLGRNCAHSSSLHIFEDSVIVECIDPETGAPLPPGQLGELVFTNLISDTQPLLRYRTRDLGRLSDGAPCRCGSRLLRIEGAIEGRSDEMIWYRGVNFFPSAVEATVRRIPGLSPEYRIVIGGEGALPTLTIQVESVEAAPSSYTVARLQREASEALRGALKVRPEVEVLPRGSLPRSEGRKLRRVVDMRRPLSAGR